MRNARGYLPALAGLAGGIAMLFLARGNKYFFGESVAVLWARPHTWGALFRDFARLDGNFWYRPLSNSLPPFLLWPLWGMHFEPYHLLAVLLHFAVVAVLFEAFRRIFDDLFAAFAGAAFFAFHPIQFYVTYDIAFYQDSMMALMSLGSLALLRAFVRRNNPAWLVAGLVVFALALTCKETSVVVPGCLFLLLWDERASRKTKAVAIGAAAVVSCAFVYFYWQILGVISYQSQYGPSWSLATGFTNAGTAMLWALGIPAGWQTVGWNYPGALQVVLAALGIALLYPRPRLWRGLAWFLGAALPTFSTSHMLPHHLYLPLVGIAFLVGSTAARVSRKWVVAAGLAVLCFTSFLCGRGDAERSWTGRSSKEVRAVERFLHGVEWKAARGVLVAGGNARNVDFDWMSGEVFNLLDDENLEVRVVDHMPQEKPPGFLILEYTNGTLHQLGPIQPEAATAVAVDLRLEPAEVHAGRDSYRVFAPQLSGQSIDVRFRYNERSPRVIYRFAQLDDKGTATIPVPAGVPWGAVQVIGVRPSGLGPWSPVNASIQVVR